MPGKSLITLAAAATALALGAPASSAAPTCQTVPIPVNDRTSVTGCADPATAEVTVEFCLRWSFDCQYLIRPQD